MALFKNDKKTYNPLMFLAALWPGWMTVVFFMYLMYLVPRNTSEFPIPTFDTLKEVCLNVDTSIFMKSVIVFWIVWIIYFAFTHLKLLFWNLKRLKAFRWTKECKALKWWNTEVTFMSIPLTLAMTINVLFILWAIFIPKLWVIVEYLFPGALVWFALVWVLALKLFSEYFLRLITQKWNADFVENNNLWQLISAFAFVMIAVWFAASSAMSTNITTATIWLVASTFFIVLASSVALLKIIVWFNAILKNGLDESASPTLWIMIPILTLIGITVVRNMHWLHGHFESEFSAWTYIMFTTVIVSMQIMFGYIGYVVMKNNWYFEHYIDWKEKNPGSFALICPWVALVVFAFFFLHLGLVKTWVVDKFSIMYFILLLPVMYLQYKTIVTMLKLNKKFGL